MDFDASPAHSMPTSGQTLDMSLNTIALDLARVIGSLFQTPQGTPGLVLVGHSMGGSVAVEVASLLTRTSPPHAADGSSPSTSYILPASKIQGVAVLDVVEGTAIAALDSMKHIILSYPSGFDSVEDAIRWHVESGTVINPDSARRSVPSLLKKNGGVADSAVPSQMTGIAEDDEEQQEEAVEELSESAEPELQPDGTSLTPATTSPSSKTSRRKTRPPAWVWVHDLLATSPFWSGWFTGLSSKFLSVRAPRLLLLAGTDRLDKELMIGQMQGKYQLAVFPEVGHSLQEDAPERTAQTLVEFWKKSNAPPPISSLSKFKPGVLPGAAPATFVPPPPFGRGSASGGQVGYQTRSPQRTAKLSISMQFIKVSCIVASVAISLALLGPTGTIAAPVDPQVVDGSAELAARDNLVARANTAGGEHELRA
ncbi:Predicted acetyltransferases and hydrolases with the alpha/beta hydrolase fold [Ceraceosorus bombacis]|uniref:Protein phosphatase methylesterase 1 n=1 Tax=Ceraceosorus bombacis TaxID=401625 RepID=A0A0P1BLB7_9BASI|nr:Predicted acetyltransferases and hydrolases with the alpha/beta hydrolase fold [Ceraceosorus bombacis]